MDEMREAFEKWYYQHYPYEAYDPLYQAWQAALAHSAAALAAKDAEIERLRGCLASVPPNESPALTAKDAEISDLNATINYRENQLKMRDAQIARLRRVVKIYHDHMETLALGDDLTAKYAAATIKTAAAQQEG